MVQARQFRKTHVDSHYASALYRYQREFSVKYRDYTTFISQDDKHSVKVGEPEYPVAAVERGKAANLTCNTPTEIPYYTAGIPQYVITVEVRLNYSKSN